MDKSNGMSKMNRLDFLLAEMDEASDREIKQMWKRTNKRATPILIGCFFLVLFLILFS